MGAAYLYISVVSKWRVAGGLLGAADTCERVFASVAAELAKEKKKKQKKRKMSLCRVRAFTARQIYYHTQPSRRQVRTTRQVLIIYIYIHCWPLITYSSIYMCTH